MENVLVAGANGKTGREIIEILRDYPDYTPIAMIRNENQQAAFDNIGVRTVLADLEGDLREAVKNVDRVIFAAGSGGQTPPQKTIDVDQDGAINLIDKAKANSTKKFIMLSSMGADNPTKGPDSMTHYFEAKKAADDHLQACFMDYSIVRPGHLTNADKTNKIKAAQKLDESGKIPRKDVAQVLVACLYPNTATNKVFEILSGDTAIELALSGIE